LKTAVSLSTFVADPYFTHVKEVLGDSVTYACKILDLNLLPLAKIGSVVTVYVKYTHNELTLQQIDEWLKIYGKLKGKSR